MKRRLAISAGLVVLILAAASGAALAAPLPVVASFSVLGDLVQQVGGDRVRVTTLVGPDGDAHVFEPSPDDARAIQAARLVVINGLGLEGWISRLIRSSGYRGPVVVASAAVTPRRGGSGTGHAAEGGVDPHAWQNVANVKAYVRAIGEGLAAADPAGAAEYRAGAAAYLGRLEALDREVRAAFAAIDSARRKIITSHDAFGYFGDAYGLALLAPVGFGTESEPSARAVGGLIDQIRREGIRAIFIENMSDPRLIQQIARESGARVGGRLFSDALSAPGGPASTYLEMVRHNKRLITDSLGRYP
ncbi:MAG: zinc ABC transporter substrate-binding protein [Rhodospirillaceae bacterium]